MNSVFDVAEYILESLAPRGSKDYITAWKLQKLVYYSQAWSLVWDEKALFPEEFQAWIDGPVCHDLFKKHRGKVRLKQGDIKKKPQPIENQDAVETIDVVLDEYGKRSGMALRALSHTEEPWINAREGCRPDQRCDTIITKESMADYYAKLILET